ncbi:glycosyltransferase family 2 protein [Nesterenkonia populi]|uniref:glycosyltransferase family 2 protein n=1 Tax=Nesterenkonia populi TaxID=1591087 RepID=UPI001478A134|nr:glycosyltransferase family 2 protein [Nesterenkonia populi]
MDSVLEGHNQITFRSRLFQVYLKMDGASGIALERTALRAESLHMRDLLAHAATHGTLNFTELKGRVLAETVSGYSLEPRALGRLAYVSALHEAEDKDLEFAVAALELALPRMGRQKGTQRFSKLLADIYAENRELGKFDALVEAHPSIKSHYYSYLTVDSRSPFLLNSSEAHAYENWLDGFNRQFIRNDLIPVYLTEGEAAPFNRLTTLRIEGPQPEGPLVTVIMTSFKPERADLLQSARSIMEQSWKNLELLVIDDASPADYQPVLDELEEMDPRIRVFRLETNGGTYAARNVGVAHARGEFITGQDADDWSHPQRIQTQVNHLLRNSHRPGNQVYTVNMTEDLVRIRRGYSPFIPSAPTLMVRTSIMLELGGYIPARKATDNEMRHRLGAYAGASVYQISEPLIFMRILPNSLSRSDFRPGWQHPARRALWSSYRRWHERASRQELQLSPTQEYPIYIPPRFTSPPEEELELDVLFVADWCEYGKTQAAALEEIRVLRRAGYSIGIMHLENAVHLSEYARTYSHPVQELISNGEVTHVIQDETFYKVKLTLVRSPELLQFMPHGTVGFNAGKTAVVAEKLPWEAASFHVNYLPSDCAHNAANFFGARPLWLAQTDAVKAQLHDMVPGDELNDAPYVVAFDAERWRTRRIRPRGRQPILGRWAGESTALWPNSPEEIEAIWPTHGEVDVRFYGAPTAVLQALGQKRLPPAWISFGEQEITRKTYYRSLDFFVHYPQRHTIEKPELPVLEALGAGCIPVLPPWMKDVYGDAAIYADPPQVQEAINQYWNETERYLAQSQRGVEFATQYQKSGYRELMDDLLTAKEPTPEEAMAR